MSSKACWCVGLVLLFVSMVLLSACGGSGQPTPEQIARICEENSDRIDRVRAKVERRGKSVLKRIKKRAQGKGVQFLIQHCLEQTDVPELNPTDVDQTVATSTFDSTRFLYTGEDPVQTGVDSGTIEFRRAAVIRGRVLDENGDPLSGATVRILNHPEFGQTVSREDGFYDMAVNGGKQYTVQVRLNDRLPVQRPVQVPWRDIARVEPFRMIGADTAVTTVDLTESQDIQLHEANTQSDSDGTRTTRMAFKPNTDATLVNVDGSTEALDSMDVRGTEYSVGPNGPEKMPAPLPQNTLYTYAAELSADQALNDTIVKRIEFSKPVSLYVDNFLSFPVGSPVPSGFYDQQKGNWVAADTASRVMEVVSVSGGQAQLDVDGDGAADTPGQLASLGITPQEQTTIANQFDAGDSFWRAPIPHFSSWDLNHGSATDFFLDLLAPVMPGGDLVCDGCKQGKNTINLHNQTLGEQVDVVGTPFSLNYQSQRTRGFRAPYTMNVNVSEATIPDDLQGISMEIRIAGRIIDRVFAPEPNLDFEFEWDGKDVYGRTVQSPKEAQVTITYLFPGAYRIGERGRNDFGKVSGGVVTTQEAREEIPVVEVFNQSMGTYQAKAQKLGGWTLDVHHMYDPDNKVLYRGDGDQREAEAFTSIHKRVAGLGEGFSGETGPALEANLDDPFLLTVGSDGSVYFVDGDREGLDPDPDRVYRIDPSGTLSIIAEGDVARLDPFHQNDIALGPDEDYLYVSQPKEASVFRVNIEGGTVTRVAGTGTAGFNGDGLPATEAQLRWPTGIDVDPQGNLYIADRRDHRIRKVDARGIITTVAGTGEQDFRNLPPNGSIATEQDLHHLDDVQVHPNGEIYYTRRGSGPDYIRKVTNSGRIQTVVHTKKPSNPRSLSFTSDGTLYFTSGRDGSFIHKLAPDGSIVNVAGASGRNGAPGHAADGTPALRGEIPGRHSKRMGLSPSGKPYYTDRTGERIMKITPSFPDVSLDEKILASEDGSRIFVFDRSGRHLRTVEARTGTTLFSFEYNSAGLLTSVTDRDGKTTTIERDSSGQATAIVSPFGQRTELTTNSNGFLTEVSNPASEAHQMAYADSGLLQSFTDPKGNQTTYSYQPDGRLAREEDPKGGFTELARSFSDTFFEVQTTTAEGRTRSFRVTRNKEGDQFRKNVGTDGLPINHDHQADATRNIQRPDGTTMATVLRPDPRFNMQSPLDGKVTIESPSGRRLNLSHTRSTKVGEALSIKGSVDTFVVNKKTFVQTYDSSTQSITSRSPVGRTQKLKLDEKSRVSTATFPNLNSIEYEYNSSGRLARVIQGRRIVERRFNDDGFLSEVTDPIGRTNSFTYDKAGRIIRKTLQDGREIGFQYDNNGNLTAIVPPGRQAHVFRYTSRDETQEYEPPSLPSGATITTWTYNQDGQPIQVELPDLSTVDFVYDQAGRLSVQDFPLDRRTYNYSQSTGRVSGINSKNGVDLTLSYDGSIVNSIQWDTLEFNAELSLKYNKNAQFESHIINGSKEIGFVYDDDGLLASAEDFKLFHDNRSGLLKSTEFFDVRTSLDHNGFGEVVARNTNRNGTPLYLTSLERDTAGRIVGLAQSISGQDTRIRTFEYDEAGRLASVNRGQGDTIGFKYDRNSNRLSRTGVGINQTDFQYDAQDRLLSYRKNGDTLVEFDYTDNGELQSKTIAHGKNTVYNYDALGNLRTVTLKGDTTIQYLIDGQNRRVGKKVNGQFKQGLIYQDQVNPVAELDGNGDIESVFVYGHKPNVPAYMIKNGTKYRIISDYLGSVRMVVNVNTGAVVQRIKYSVFGRVLLDTNPGFQPFGFAGGLYDHHTGLVRFGVRDYDPTIGRWTSKDPILFSGGDPNLYGYVLNDPINANDPHGMQSATIPVLPTLGPEGRESLNRNRTFGFNPYTPTPYNSYVERVYGDATGPPPFNRAGRLREVSDAFPDAPVSNCIRGCLLAQFNPRKGSYEKGFVQAHAFCFSDCGAIGPSPFIVNPGAVARDAKAVASREIPSGGLSCPISR